MATFYSGYRNVLRGVDADNFIHTYTGAVGVYSNWSLMNTGGQVLSGFPDRQYALGTYAQAGFLEYLYAGKHHIAPMEGAGNGNRQAGARYRPLEYKGLTGAMAFPSTFGHADRETSYSAYNNFSYDGISVAEALKAPGHARRFTTSYGGASEPNIRNGVGTGALDNPGTTLPAGYDNAYGKNKVNEWRGTPSSRAL